MEVNLQIMGKKKEEEKQEAKDRRECVLNQPPAPFQVASKRQWVISAVLRAPLKSSFMELKTQFCTSRFL